MGDLKRELQLNINGRVLLEDIFKYTPFLEVLPPLNIKENDALNWRILLGQKVIGHIRSMNASSVPTQIVVTVESGLESDSTVNLMLANFFARLCSIAIDGHWANSNACKVSPETIKTKGALICTARFLRDGYNDLWNALLGLENTPTWLHIVDTSINFEYWVFFRRSVPKNFNVSAKPVIEQFRSNNTRYFSLFRSDLRRTQPFSPQTLLRRGVENLDEDERVFYANLAPMYFDPGFYGHGYVGHLHELIPALQWGRSKQHPDEQVIAILYSQQSPDGTTMMRLSYLSEAEDDQARLVSLARRLQDELVVKQTLCGFLARGLRDLMYEMPKYGNSQLTNMGQLFIDVLDRTQSASSENPALNSTYFTSVAKFLSNVAINQHYEALKVLTQPQDGHLGLSDADAETLWLLVVPQKDMLRDFILFQSEGPMKRTLLHAPQQFHAAEVANADPQQAQIEEAAEVLSDESQQAQTEPTAEDMIADHQPSKAEQTAEVAIADPQRAQAEQTIDKKLDPLDLNILKAIDKIHAKNEPVTNETIIDYLPLSPKTNEPYVTETISRRRAKLRRLGRDVD